MPRAARPLWTTDCETDPFKVGRVPQPFLWGLYEGDTDTYHEFETAEEIIAFFQSEYASNKRPIVYAHNGGKFDYHYLKDGFNSDEPIMIIAGRFAKFRIGECEFRDSLNIFTQTALEKFGGKIKIDYAKFEADVRDQHRDEIRTYLRQDCVLLHDSLARYFKEYGRGLTQAGTSMRYWAKKYKKTPPKQAASRFQEMRPFFYGGRVECFQSGHEHVDFKVIDINSAYPRAMLEKHPFSPNPIVTPELPATGVEQCLIRLHCVSRGALPWRSERDELFFPADNERREYFVTGWEYLMALKYDALSQVEIEEVYSFAEHVDFTDYVMEFYAKRKEAKACGDKAQDIFAKIFMNSLYGKFASDPERYKEWVIASEDSHRRWVEDGFTFIEPWNTRFLMTRPLPEQKHRYYNIATAASITGWVRAFLYEAIQQCEGVIYCDTDSLAARDVSRLQLGSELGEWKLEMACNEFAVAGKKMYAFASTESYSDEEGEKKGLKSHAGKWWKCAHKGVDLSPDEIIRVARGEKVIYKAKVPTYSVNKGGPHFTDRVIGRTVKRLGERHVQNS